MYIVCCAKLLLDPNSKITCLNVASFLGRKAFENLGFHPKIQKDIFFAIPFCNIFLKPAMYSLIFLNAKNEMKRKKIF